MNLSDLPSYSSDSRSHTPPNDDDKWIYDDPLSTVNPPKSKNSIPETKLDSLDDGHEIVPKLMPETKIESSSSMKSAKSSRSNQPVKRKDISDSESHAIDESSSQSASKRSQEPSELSEKPAHKKGSKGYAPQIQIALSGTKLAFANGAWQDVSDIGELVDKVHPIVAESICLQKRAELLVKLIAKSEYESQLIQNEMNECDEIIKELREILGEDDSNTQSTIVEEEDEQDEF